MKRASSHDLLEEGVRHLDEHAGAVAGVGLAAAGAAMIEVAQHLDGLLQDAVRLAALDVDDEADAAGLVLEPRIVEPLFVGRDPASGAGSPALRRSLRRDFFGAGLSLLPRSLEPRPCSSPCNEILRHGRLR